MRLNKEQAKHLADSTRIVAIAQFGYFGYHGLVEWKGHWFTLVWAVFTYVAFEWFAVRLLQEDEDGSR